MASSCRAVPLCSSRSLLRCWQQVRAVSTAGAMCQRTLSLREWRLSKNEQLRKNRRDSELEKKARSNQLELPLETVHREWKEYVGLQHMRTMAQHCQLYRDVFGAVFTPSVFPEVVYPEGHAVEQGNLLAPRCALQEPTMCLPQGLTDGYTTLIMTNPDGHLTDPNMELLHWMIADIPSGGEVSAGRVVTSYLPPLPPSGTGFHRYIFTLYSHPHPLSLTTPTDHTHDWLEQRTFSTVDFLATQSEVCPIGFSYFQSQWDSSVREVYNSTLVHPEPVYGVLRQLTPRQARQREIKVRRAARFSVM